MGNNIKTGIGLEYILVDKNLELYPQGHKIAESLGDPRITNEFGTYQIEISTYPHESLNDLREETGMLIRKIASNLPKEVNMLPIGTYPYSFNTEVTPNQRLLDITKSTNETYGFEMGRGVELETGLQAFQSNFSIIGGNDADLVKIHQICRPLIPLLVAASANSPYFQGMRIKNSNSLADFLNDNGNEYLINGRRHIWELCEGVGTVNDTGERHGIPPRFSSQEDYLTWLNKVGVMGDTTSTGVESTVYSDIRLRTQEKSGKTLPESLRRVEFRPCDILPTLKENFSIVSFMRAYIRSKMDGGNIIDITEDRDKLKSLSTSVMKYGLNTEINGKTMGYLLSNAANQLKDYAIGDFELNSLNDFSNLLENNRSEEHVKLGSESYISKIINEFNKENQI